MDSYIIENKKQQAILESLAKIFVTVHMIDIDKQTFYKVECAEYVNDVLRLYPVAQDAFDKVIEYLVVKDSEDEMTDFLNISTLKDRLKDKDMIMCDFIGTVEKWSRGYFIALSRDENNLVKEVVFTVQNIDRERSKIETFKKLSETDGLTGLLNRNALKNHYENMFDKNVSMIMMDIDHFKNFNDTYGHDFGDKVIKLCASKIMEEFVNCYCYRYGGDEYLVIAIDRNEKTLREQVDRVIMTIGQEKLGEGVPEIKISSGIVAGHPMNQLEIDNLFNRADKLMYDQKQRRNSR